jgi:hypothetical protein
MVEVAECGAMIAATIQARPRGPRRYSLQHDVSNRAFDNRSNLDEEGVMGGLSEQQGPMWKSAIVSVVLQLIVAYLAKSNPSLASMLGTMGTPAMAGIAGLLFSMWAKGASTGTAAAGGAVSGIGAGLVSSLLEGALGGGGINLGAVGGDTAMSGVGGLVGAAVGSMLGLGKRAAV